MTRQLQILIYTSSKATTITYTITFTKSCPSAPFQTNSFHTKNVLLSRKTAVFFWQVVWRRLVRLSYKNRTIACGEQWLHHRLDEPAIYL